MDIQGNPHLHTREVHPIRKRKLPINLLRKAIREDRQYNIMNTTRPRKVRKKKKSAVKCDREHLALVQATEQKLKEILENDEILSDIPYDCTPEELLGEIALARGHATTVYIERDGLSTLTIVLPQQNPTIANLKRAIEATARVQQKRELRQRHEERIQRRCENETKTEQQQQQVIMETTPNALVEPIRNTGDLVYSAACSGQHHRANVSWRFLWRAYALFNVSTKLPINDENGRQTLSASGIENATTLKFCNREKYFKRKRQ